MTVKFLSFVTYLVILGSTIICLSLIALPPKTQAHSGRTDASGGHNCNVGSCAGTYHYHNGGGGSSSTLDRLNYVDLGLANGKAHALRDAEHVQAQTKAAAYQAGQEAGQSGSSKGLMIPPSHICDVNFNFDAGTSETYQSWYKTGWSNECNSIARSVYELSYDAGYIKGTEIKATTVASTQSGRSTDDKANNEIWLWAVLGAFVGLPILVELLRPSKKT